MFFKNKKKHKREWAIDRDRQVVAVRHLAVDPRHLMVGKPQSFTLAI